LPLILVAWTGLAFAIGAATQATGFFGIVVRPLIEGGVEAPFRWARARLTAPPRVEIDLAFEDLRRVEFQRARAIEERALFVGEDDEVPARVRAEGKDLKVKLRLKGDSATHLLGEKWSFRVDVRGEETIFGMKRFSLQHPVVRGFVDEWVYHRAMAREGVIALRYDFVDVALNGKSLGIYAVEEHFEKRLIEHNKRREGPILRFHEDLMWREAHHQTRPFRGSQRSGYGDYEASHVDGFRTNRTLADPVLRASYEKAVHLLEAFRRRERPVGEVFDLEIMATYYAMTDLLGGEHGARWHNIRFYFNPVTARLEPIAFDGECAPLTAVGAMDPPGREPDGRAFESARPLRRTLFEDPEFERRYLEELVRVSEPTYLEGLWADLQPALEQNLRILHREFPQVRAPVELLARNQAYIRSALDPVAGIRVAPLEFGEGELRLTAGNLQALPIEIVGIDLDGAAHGPLLLESPIRLEGRRRNQDVEWRELTVPAPEAATQARTPTGRALWRVVGTEPLREATLALIPPAASAPAALDDPTRLADNSFEFAFLRHDERARTIDILPGSWQLADDLRIEPGWLLRAGPGTRLDLVASAGIVSRSPVEWRGTPDAPVELVSSDGTGRGLTVLQASAPSTLVEARFRGLRARDSEAWRLTGAVTFYESDVEVERSEFVGNPAEDALNVVRSNFRLDEVLFQETQSDAFDADFCDGSITNSRFVDLTNDGIDVSGSTVRIDNVTVDGSGDKAVSVGEASDVTASHLRIRGAVVALASKDRSTLVADDIELEGCRFALAAFQKKSEFGPGSIDVRGIRTRDMTVQHLVEEGSRVTIDGRRVPASDDQDIREILYGESGDVSQRP
jgi:hypothetical protein